ncbi:hypothetical protein BGP_3597 [Beggiatoa sp. PS]|nr:hypothetical protein BGP_3597 [Beggiatoa sp. PS]
MSQNVRRSFTESYDPKQRFVGGVVLFLLMLFIYGTLKLVLGFSSIPEGEYRLSAPLIDEEFPATKLVETSVETSENDNSLASVAANNTPTPTPTLSSSSNTSAQGTTESYRLPGKFIFLNLNGKPMRPNLDEMIVHKPKTTTTSNVDPKVLFDKPSGENRWYVQVASLRTEEQAQRIIQKIKNKNVANQAYIIRKGSWYVIQLHPTTEDLVHQQKQQLRRKLSLKTIIRELK